MRKKHRFALCISLLLLIVMCATLFFVGCGANNGVPDQVAEYAVLDYLDGRSLGQGEYNNYSFTVTHNVDKNSNIDHAVIDLEIQYNYATEKTRATIDYFYDRGSEHWNVERAGEWSDAVFAPIPEKLPGPWRIDYFNDCYELNIDSVRDNNVTMSYRITTYATVSMGLDPDRPLQLSGNGTFSINGKSISIPVDLPDGFYCNKGGGRVGEKSTELVIFIEPMTGCTQGYLNGSLSYIEP